MADHEYAKLDQENHLILDQPLLRLPFELLRKNFRSAHWEVERDASWVKNALKETATAAVNGQLSQQDVLKSLDSMLGRMRGMTRKLTAFAEEENRLYRHEEARVRHLADIYGMHSVDDVKYEAWSRTRLDRLMVDYMLRHGHNASARMLAEEKGIELLVDVETFEQMSRIRDSIRNRSVAEALAWCTAGDIKKELRKMDSNLEFMLRYQQYIELVRSNSARDLHEAILHAKKYLHPYRKQHPKAVQQACGLLAMPPQRAHLHPEYNVLYAEDRWEMLAELFQTTHNTLLSLPSIPLLHIALSSGLSALKTPACHSGHSKLPPSHAIKLASSVCPICSTELNELARKVPYAHHTQSHVDPDLLLLPNGRAYGKALLDGYSEKSGLLAGQVKDPRTGEVFSGERLKKVFIT